MVLFAKFIIIGWLILIALCIFANNWFILYNGPLLVLLFPSYIHQRLESSTKKSSKNRHICATFLPFSLVGQLLVWGSRLRGGSRAPTNPKDTNQTHSETNTRTWRYSDKCKRNRTRPQSEFLYKQNHNSLLQYFSRTNFETETNSHMDPTRDEEIRHRNPSTWAYPTVI